MTKRFQLRQKEGIVVVISGPSGVGKNSVIRALRQQYNDMRHSVSMTTRRPRAGEIDGVHYIFKSRREFEDLIEAGEILEYDTYLGEYYGTPLAPLMRLKRENLDIMLDLTVKGALALREYDEDVVSIFLVPPSEEELYDRLARRGTENDELIKKRLQNASQEMESAHSFDYLVLNDRLPEAVHDIEAIMWAEKHHTARVFIDEIGL